MSDSYDDYEAKMQLAEHKWEIKEARRQGASEVMRRSHSSKGKHMNKEDIIRIAREAGLRVGTNLSGVVLVGSPAEIGLAHLTIEELERFAALVAAAEREACAKVCDGLGVHPALNVFNGGPEWYKHGKDCAAAIRARGNT